MTAPALGLPAPAADLDVPPVVPYPGVPEALDGSSAVVAMETAASEAAGVYPITPSTQMGEGWSAAVAEGRTNVNGRRLLFFEPEGEHAAAAVTAGMSVMGLRATNFSSGQGVAYMHESLYAAVGKRLTYVLNVSARAITKHALNVHAGHDDYHAVDDTGFFQLFAKDVQEVADLNLIAHRVAELALNPGIIAQDGFLTSHVIETARVPERELVKTFLGDPSDQIDSPTPAQRLVFGAQRRRIPELFDVDYPAMIGTVQNQDSYAQGVAAQRPFWFDHVADLTDRAMREYAELTGRRYARVMSYKLEDAEYVILGQGSVCANAEAVADYLRRERGLRVGVVHLTMFRPFPSDLLTRMLAGKKAVVVLERTDQPLAVDPPILREVRAALSQAAENARAAQGAPLPFPTLATIGPEQVPSFYSGCFGLGSRDLQPGDLVAAVDNMLPGGAQRRQFYLGIDFVRPNAVAKVSEWQDELVKSYPHLATLALPSAGDLDLMPAGALSVRIHSVGGWGAITMGKNLASTAFELFGLHIKANPKYGSEKKGQPTTFFATFAHEPIKLNAELRHVDVVLSPDPNVFNNSNPLAGISQGGVFVLQSELRGEAVWQSIPGWARAEIARKQIRFYAIDAFRIAAAEASELDLRYRMQGTAFMGAFFHVSPLLEREHIDEEALFDGVREQLTQKFGKKGQRVVEDNLRVLHRGFDEVHEVPVGHAPPEVHTRDLPVIPSSLHSDTAEPGLANPDRFFDQVCTLCAISQDGIADPFAAVSVLPAATGVVRDMSGVRQEVPKFLAERCTGCGNCWTQCPDSAIPALVNSVEEVLLATIDTTGTQALRGTVSALAAAIREELGTEGTTMHVAIAAAWARLREQVGIELDEDVARVQARLAELPLARTKPFWYVPEKQGKGNGGLLSLTINPESCKGCNLCVNVCPEEALVTVKQDATILAHLRRNHEVWEHLPDTNDRFVKVTDLAEGKGVLTSLLLKKQTYRSMVGGDGACMGCGEKTAVHLVVSSIEALMRPRVEAYVTKLETLIHDLQQQGDRDEQSLLVARTVRALEDLVWRYRTGPSGKGRAHLAMANSTGCSSVWGSTYPYNPYPFPWVNHLFQDSPSVAIGVFEGHMRKMADGFAHVRRAQALAAGMYDQEALEPVLAGFDWKQFDDEEFGMCPPIISMGGDGAMLDIGFQNLSRLMASGKPIRVIVLDTQVYSNTGGQACTSGFTGQVADMTYYGRVQHGKSEARKELALIALAHRGVYVHQTSQATPSHLIAGVLRGLQKRRPVLINIYTPCPVEHGLADDMAQHAAKLALESRAFPFLTYDPDAGASVAECLSLNGNPSVKSAWPQYTLRYLDDTGVEQAMELPLTTADWAATEGRFRKHFAWAEADASQVPYHEFLQLPPAERVGKRAFVYTTDDSRRLRRLLVAAEMVALGEERQQYWNELRELAGVEPSPKVRQQVTEALTKEYEQKLEALKAEYEAKLAELGAGHH
jgi:pyruvate-ferredoxin/flavodoxin oxidoreductase